VHGYRLAYADNCSASIVTSPSKPIPETRLSVINSLIDFFFRSHFSIRKQVFWTCLPQSSPLPLTCGAPGGSHSRSVSQACCSVPSVQSVTVDFVCGLSGRLGSSEAELGKQRDVIGRKIFARQRIVLDDAFGWRCFQYASDVQCLRTKPDVVETQLMHCYAVESAAVVTVCYRRLRALRLNAHTAWYTVTVPLLRKIYRVDQKCKPILNDVNKSY